MGKLYHISGPLDWKRAKPSLQFVSLVVFLVLVGLTFLGKPSAPTMIVANNDHRLGIIEVDQFKAILDKSLLEYTAWTKQPIKPQQKLRSVIRADDDQSLIARGGLNWIARSPANEASVNQSDFVRATEVDGAREASVWGKRTRDELSSPIKLLARPPVTKDHKLHIARIPPRAAKPMGIGHVKPDSNREAVWLKPRSFSLADSDKDTDGRARKLDPAVEYSVGWLFIITTCDYPYGCKLGQDYEADCLMPETLTDHVLGMMHLVIPRRYLYASKEGNDDDQNTIIGSDILKGGGLALLTGADYDYVSLRVSHYPAGGRKPFGIDKKSDSSETEPSHTRETSIAMLDERLHEILAMINRADDLNEGDLVLILPTALDFQLGEGDFLIVGFEEIPPPLRSHYRGLSAKGLSAEPVNAPSLDLEDHDPRPAASTAQSRKAASRIRAAVDE